MKHRDAFNALLKSDFQFFLRAVFATLNPGELFKDNWHVDAMSHSLDQVRQGRSKRLLITIPPRHLKSITVSVAFPAWVLGRDPTQRFLVSSYGSELAAKLSRDFRSIMESAWYRSAFPAIGVPTRNTDGELVTRHGGGRKAVSVGGATTGFGADYIIVDDLMKAADATSPAARDAAIEYYRGSLISRLNDQENGRIIVIAQRLHEADVPGHCMESRLFDHLNLPAIAQGRQEVRLSQGQVHVRSVGDLLFPQQQSRAVLDQLRIELGPTAFSAQYLQDPTPAESNLIRWDQIHRYEEAPSRRRLEYLVQSWDTAMTPEATGDWSVCTTWGFSNGAWLLLDVLRFRSTYPELLDRVKTHRDRWKPELLIIEDCATGRPLIDDLNHEARTRPRSQEQLGWRVHAYRPRVDKVERYGGRIGARANSDAFIVSSACRQPAR